MSGLKCESQSDFIIFIACFDAAVSWLHTSCEPSLARLCYADSAHQLLSIVAISPVAPGFGRS